MEVRLYADVAAGSHSKMLDNIFGDNGLPLPSAGDIEAEFKMLETLQSREEPRVPGETTRSSLIARVFLALTQSESSKTKLKHAEDALRQGNEYRTNHHHVGGPGNNGAPYKSQAKKGDDLEAYVEGKKTEMKVAAVVLAAFCVHRTFGGQRITVMGMIMSFILV
jgi:hypothetical protein